jgi:vacuolar protein-sorting-associated protein 4
LLARATANEVSSAYFKASCADLTSKWVGGSEKLIRSLFVSARNSCPSIIFLDEIDSIASSRGTDKTMADQRLTNQLLIELDTNQNEEKSIIVIAATNLPWVLDVAVLRRFPRQVYIPLPDNAARREMITKIQSTNMNISADIIEYIADNSGGFSGSDISSFMNDICIESIRILGRCTSFEIKREKTDNLDEQISVKCTAPGSCTSEHDANSWVVHNTTLENIVSEFSEESIVIPQVGIDYIRESLNKIKPTVNNEYTMQYENFHRKK